jgi:ABC-type transport system involved in multi-copper enzyme maturation permease subunit
MTILPVIERELRAAARQPFTYHLRLLGVAALLLAGLMFGLDYGFGANRGVALFGRLHTALFVAIWVLVPLLTADCLSRERREGTLGLLFMTPLRAGGVVIAKGLAHGLRAATLWLAVLPVLTIPFLLGGVSLLQASLSMLVNFSAICWALAAGLLASAWNRAWTRALLGSALLALVFVLALGFSAGVFLVPTVAPWGSASAPRSPLFALMMGSGFVANWLGVWPAFFARSPSAAQLMWSAGSLAGLSLMVLAAAIVIAGTRTGRTWQEGPPSERQLWWQATFCRPVLWVSFFRRWMRWKLEHNPVGWLAERTWSSRLVTWGWLAVVIALYSAVLTDQGFYRNYGAMQSGIAWVLAATIGLSAASSFQRERETRVLELLLVSPLRESSIIWGRLRGLWGQFLPAVSVLLGIWWSFSNIFDSKPVSEIILFHGLTFIALPVVGLYFSLCCRSFMGAFLSTLAAGLCAPLMLILAVRSCFGWHTVGLFASPYALAGLVELVLAVVLWQRLYARLCKRAFRLEDWRQ